MNQERPSRLGAHTKEMSGRDGLRAAASFLQARVSFKQRLVHKDERVEDRLTMANRLARVVLLELLEVRHHERQELWRLIVSPVIAKAREIFL